MVGIRPVAGTRIGPGFAGHPEQQEYNCRKGKFGQSRHAAGYRKLLSDRPAIVSILQSGHIRRIKNYRERSLLLRSTTCNL